MTQLTNTRLVSPTILGALRLQVVPTNSLPAAGAINDGLILIEDAGTGNQNLIIYSKGLRYRIDGGTHF